MRSILLAFSLLVAVSGIALADTMVAGDWRADLGQGVSIDMNVTPKGDWSSETRQGNQVVRRMHGTYKQSQSGDGSGTLVFTPIGSVMGNGNDKVETDQYQITESGEFDLRTSPNGVMSIAARCIAARSSVRSGAAPPIISNH